MLPNVVFLALLATILPISGFVSVPTDEFEVAHSVCGTGERHLWNTTLQAPKTMLVHDTTIKHLPQVFRQTTSSQWIVLNFYRANCPFSQRSFPTLHLLAQFFPRILFYNVNLSSPDSQFARMTSASFWHSWTQHPSNSTLQTLRAWKTWPVPPKHEARCFFRGFPTIILLRGGTISPRVKATPVVATSSSLLSSS
eukprot:TRINITY_DN11790_c0_g1_i1.p1 TRINITY_DN11790_c0_g1~~TRINITY_DN11790_c0_g1_i1.p1  ORF type:complete len:196 (-),score=7.01 TRINITY_DN11790_c0_g1_i1:54-641(-)